MLYYLNNSGSKWIVKPSEKVLVYHGVAGYCKIRSIRHFEAFGNFVTAHLKYNGKMISGFIEDCNGVKVLFVDYKEKYKG